MLKAKNPKSLRKHPLGEVSVLAGLKFSNGK